MLRTEFGQRLLALVDALPLRQREAVVLRYYEDLAVAQIASVLGIRAGAVSSALDRALKPSAAVSEPTMTSELEDTLRAALHERGAAITADRLRPPDSARQATPQEPVWAISTLVKPDRRPRSVGARIAPILAAAAVVGIIVTLALAVSGGSGPSQPAGGQSTALAGVLGRTWVLKTVQAPDGNTTTISMSTDASVTFLGTADRIEFQDGLAAFQARYTTLSDGRLQVHGVSVTTSTTAGTTAHNWQR